ncbi:YraN family protein [Bdellovibrio sp. GT3]|uniref:YraN family protein n=1 Tax=Bdellovibrio sp. GT3 TaxID=3136282 RepID=UPI0030F30C40
MASKVTKVTQPQFTSNPSSSTVHAKSIASPSLASKSTSDKKIYWAHKRGVQSEEFVSKYYINRNYQLLKQRVKTPYAEIDLLFRSPSREKLLMVEVKTANQATFYNARISPRQKFRLMGAAVFLAARFNCQVEVHWAFVTRFGEITIIDDVT